MSRRFHNEDETFGPGSDLTILILILVLLLSAFNWSNSQLSAMAEKLLSKEHALFQLVDNTLDRPLFEQGEDAITERGKQMLRKEISKLKQSFKISDINQLLLVGHASPEANTSNVGVWSDRKTRRERENFVLSIRRAVSVADFLYLEGIPYECMSVIGYGRSLSATLRNFLENQTSPSAKTWDDYWDKTTEKKKRDFESGFKDERRVEIIGVLRKGCNCELSQTKRTGNIIKQDPIETVSQKTEAYSKEPKHKEKKKALENKKEYNISRKLYFYNDCGVPISLAITFQDQKSKWLTKGWFTLPVYEGRFLSADGEIISLSNDEIYYYAENKKHGLTWKGEAYQTNLSGRSLEMKKINASVNTQGDYSYSIKCEKHDPLRGKYLLGLSGVNIDHFIHNGKKLKNCIKIRSVMTGMPASNAGLQRDDGP